MMLGHLDKNDNRVEERRKYACSSTSEASKKKKKKPASTHWGRWHRYVRLVTWGDLVNRLLSVNHTACASPHAEVLDVRMKDLTS